jgi:hypothetical protein
MTKAPPCIDDAIKSVADLGHDLSSAPTYGFTLSQDDCWNCARAIDAVLTALSAKGSQHGPGTREGRRERSERGRPNQDLPSPSETKL